VEVALGLLALIFHPVFLAVEGALFGDAIAGSFPAGMATGLRWSAAVLLILPQSVLLGATFPLMAGGFVRRFPERPGAALAILYFANALGGAVGVLVSGFVLIGRIGLPGTVMAAGAMNLTVAVLVGWRCGRGEEERPPVTAPTARPSPEALGLGTALILVAGLAGFASFVYEIVWIRMLSLVLSNSPHAFELMLSAFILGIALGGLWIRGRADGLEHPVRFLGRVQIAMGALAVATLPLYMALFPWMQHLMETLPRSSFGYLRFNLWSHGMALVVMLPATVCAGITLPLLTHVLLARGFGERSIGRVYGVNTVGAMLGAILATQVLLPVLGLKGALLLGAVVNLSVGWWLGRQETEGEARSREMAWAAWGALAVGAVVLFTGLDRAVLSSGVYRRDIDLAVARQAEVLRHVDGRTSSVSLVEDRGVLSIRTNGRGESSIALPGRDQPTWDETISTVGAALGLMLHPEARTAVNIGLGAGTTTHTLLASPTLESVTTLELEKAVVELAPEFSTRNHRVFDDPRSRIIVQDARAFLASSEDRFDLIVAQPPNLWVDGVGSLY
jgi:predicted membrane-bound spermidine synthase